MKYGGVNVEGLYTVPSGSGNQFVDGATKIFGLGLRTLKVYCTQDYVAKYPYQTWSSSPTTCAQLVQTNEYKTALSMSWDTVVMTTFAFGNPANNWWRTGADKARLDVEYDEIYTLARYLLTQFSGSGKNFILQNWEGDWAFMDAFDPTTNVDRVQVSNYAAFLARRQKAVSDARRATPHAGVSVQHAIEVNRVLDVLDSPVRRRILKDIFPRVQPDLVSYSAYDSTIATYGYGADQTAWNALMDEHYVRALRAIKRSAPGVPVYIGEFGYPENEIVNERPSFDVGAMVSKTDLISRNEGLKYLIFWEVFDNEPSVAYGSRGYWMYDRSGSMTPSGIAMSSSAATYGP